MPSAVLRCPRCDYIAEFRHTHVRAYADLNDTHMSGSERFTCTSCNHSVGCRDGDAHLFTFVLDKKEK